MQAIDKQSMRQVETRLEKKGWLESFCSYSCDSTHLVMNSSKATTALSQEMRFYISCGVCREKSREILHFYWLCTQTRENLQCFNGGNPDQNTIICTRRSAATFKCPDVSTFRNWERHWIKNAIQEGVRRPVLEYRRTRQKWSCACWRSGELWGVHHLDHEILLGDTYASLCVVLTRTCLECASRPTSELSSCKHQRYPCECGARMDEKCIGFFFISK